MPSADLRRSFRERLDSFAHELAPVGDGDVEALHRAPVASRRLRELLPLLELERALTRNLGRRLRKVTKQLRHARQLYALAQARTRVEGPRCWRCHIEQP